MALRGHGKCHCRQVLGAQDSTFVLFELAIPSGYALEPSHDIPWLKPLEGFVGHYSSWVASVVRGVSPPLTRCHEGEVARQSRDGSL